MKKKSLLTMVASLALVGAMGIGATLAYFVDQTDTLTNIFTIAQEGISLKLFEHEVITGDGATGYDVDMDEKVYAEEGAGNNYTNLIPGQIVTKDPTVEVGAGSVKCAIYVSVENGNRELLNEYDYIAEGWEYIDSNGDIDFYEYVGDNTDGSYEVIDATSGTVEKVVFDKVQVATLDGNGQDVNEDTVLPQIIIKAAAVQVEDASVEGGLREAADVEMDGLELLGYESAR